MILNPNAPIRTALKSALTPIGLPIFAKRVPKDTKLTQYIILSSQTKNRTEVSKDCFDWSCTIHIECINYNQSGFVSPKSNDDIEEQIIDIIQSGIDIDNFIVKDTTFIQSIDLDIDTPTATIERRVITYQFWVGNAMTT